MIPDTEKSQVEQSESSPKSPQFISFVQINNDNIVEQQVNETRDQDKSPIRNLCQKRLNNYFRKLSLAFYTNSSSQNLENQYQLSENNQSKLKFVDKYTFNNANRLLKTKKTTQSLECRINTDPSDNNIDCQNQYILKNTSNQNDQYYIQAGFQQNQSVQQCVTERFTIKNSRRESDSYLQKLNKLMESQQNLYQIRSVFKDPYYQFPEKQSDQDHIIQVNVPQSQQGILSKNQKLVKTPKIKKQLAETQTKNIPNFLSDQKNDKMKLNLNNLDFIQEQNLFKRSISRKNVDWRQKQVEDIQSNDEYTTQNIQIFSPRSKISQLKLIQTKLVDHSNEKLTRLSLKINISKFKNKINQISSKKKVQEDIKTIKKSDKLEQLNFQRKSQILSPRDIKIYDRKNQIRKNSIKLECNEELSLKRI